MKVIKTIELWAIHFPRGHEPSAIPARVSVADSSGRLYLQTPSAMLDYYGTETTDEDVIRQAGTGYYRSQDDCWEEINRRYPYWQANQAIMARLEDAIRWDGTLCGVGGLADAMGMSGDTLHSLARGKVKATMAQFKAASNYGGLVRGH